MNAMKRTITVRSALRLNDLRFAALELSSAVSESIYTYTPAMHTRFSQKFKLRIRSWSGSSSLQPVTTRSSTHCQLNSCQQLHSC